LLLPLAASSLITAALLSGASQSQEAREQGEWVLIDGSKTPWLIDDRDAYASFCIAMAEKRSAADIKRGDFLRETGISAEGAKFAFSTCDRYFDAFLDLKRRMVEVKNSAPRPYTSETYAAFDKLVAENQAAAEKVLKAMEEGLTRSDFRRLNEYVQYRIKSGMFIGKKK
jgi:hypothetical protein